MQVRLRISLHPCFGMRLIPLIPIPCDFGIAGFTNPRVKRATRKWTDSRGKLIERLGLVAVLTIIGIRRGNHWRLKKGNLVMIGWHMTCLT